MSSPVSALSEFYDVSRVEVQRGPQGTLFGRNATGGLIQIITNKPTADFSGGASLQYGSFGQIILEGHQNLPISKTIRTRTAFIYNRDDGFQKNRYTGTRFGKTKVWGIRETIAVDLRESITNSFIVNYSSTVNNPEDRTSTRLNSSYSCKS